MPENQNQPAPKVEGPVASKPAKGMRKLKRLFSNKKALKKIALALLLVALLVGAYCVGDRRGAKRQLAYDKAHPTTNHPSTSSNGSKRAVLSGSLTKDADKSSLEVKAKDGKISKVTIDDKTTILDAKGQKTDVAHLKKDAKVTVTTITDKDNKTRADRIRVLP